MRKRVCNMCGKDFDIWDNQEDFALYRNIGYGSKYDEHKIELDLCCNCFDKLVDEYIVPNCKINPMEDCG